MCVDKNQREGPECSAFIWRGESARLVGELQGDEREDDEIKLSFDLFVQSVPRRRNKSKQSYSIVGDVGHCVQVNRPRIHTEGLK